MCDCDMMGPPEFYVQALVKARKPHECCECRETIAVGQRYVSCRGKWEGTIDSYAVCVNCDALRDCLEEHDCCAPLGGLWAEVRELAEYGSTDGMPIAVLLRDRVE